MVRRRSMGAMALFAIVLVELLAVGVGWSLTGMSAAAAVDSFMVPNATIGGCCGVCGVLIAAYRPDNRLGWLLLGAGVCQTGTAAVTPWLVQALQVGAPETTVRWLATLYSAAWPWSIALFIPLALLSFPSGHLPGLRWRWLVPVVAVNSVGAGAAVQRRHRPAGDRRRAGPCPSKSVVLPGAGLVGARGRRRVRLRAGAECDVPRRAARAGGPLPPRHRTGAQAAAVVAVRRCGRGGAHRGHPTGWSDRPDRLPGRRLHRHRVDPDRHDDRRPASPAARHPAGVVSRGDLCAADGGGRRHLSRVGAGRRPPPTAGGRAGHLGVGDAARRGGVPPGPVAVAARRRPAALRPTRRSGARRDVGHGRARGRPAARRRALRAVPGTAPALRPPR